MVISRQDFLFTTPKLITATSSHCSFADAKSDMPCGLDSCKVYLSHSSWWWYLGSGRPWDLERSRLRAAKPEPQERIVPRPRAAERRI